MPKALPRGEKEGASRQVSREDRTGKHRIEAGITGAIPQHLRTIRAAPKTGQYRTASQKRTQTIPCTQLTNAASFCRTVFPGEFPGRRPTPPSTPRPKSTPDLQPHASRHSGIPDTEHKRPCSPQNTPRRTQHVAFLSSRRHRSSGPGCGPDAPRIPLIPGAVAWVRVFAPKTESRPGATSTGMFPLRLRRQSHGKSEPAPDAITKSRKLIQCWSNPASNNVPQRVPSHQLRRHHSVRPDRHPDHRKPRIKQCQRQQQNRNHGLASRTGHQTARCHQHDPRCNTRTAPAKILATLHPITLCRTAPRPLGTSVPTEQTTAPCESSCSAPAAHANPRRRPHTADCAQAPE